MGGSRSGRAGHARGVFLSKFAGLAGDLPTACQARRAKARSGAFMSDSAPKNLVSTATASASIVSPLDERYASVMRPIAAHMSEYGLLKYRVAVEIEWLLFMAARPEFTHVSPLSTEQQATLRGWVDGFDETESGKIKATDIRFSTT